MTIFIHIFLPHNTCFLIEKDKKIFNKVNPEEVEAQKKRERQARQAALKKAVLDSLKEDEPASPKSPKAKSDDGDKKETEQAEPTKDE